MSLLVEKHSPKYLNWFIPMEKRPVFLLLLSSCIAFGQEKMERIAPQDHRFHDILGELGLPMSNYKLYFFIYSI